MSASKANVSFAELLANTDSDAAKWRRWFDEQPLTVLDLPLSIALAKNVREFLLHIFAVELRYAERLTGTPVTEYETLPTTSIADLFGVSERARVLYRQYLDTATDDDLAKVMEFPTRTAGIIRSSKRKMFAHALIHSMRHWAQLATALREAGSDSRLGALLGALFSRNSPIRTTFLITSHQPLATCILISHSPGKLHATEIRLRCLTIRVIRLWPTTAATPHRAAR